MDRQAVIEATIDYVMTKLRHQRSVGPAWIRYQEREVHEAKEKKFDQNKRQPIYKPNPNSLKPKWNLTKFDPAKRQLMKKLSEHQVTSVRRIRDNLWVTTGSDKPKPKSASRMTPEFRKKLKNPRKADKRAELTDRIVKKHTASSAAGKAKAIFTKLPSQVAAEKKSPLGTHLAKHMVQREMVKRARGKSALPK